MAFRDLTDFLTVKPIELPIGGKFYAFPRDISGKAGLVIAAIREAAEAADRGKDYNPEQVVLDDAAEVDLRREVLGDTEREMFEAGLTTGQVEHVFRTLMTWHMSRSMELTEAAWEMIDVDPPKPNREQRRASGAAASKTPSPASTSGTSPSAAPRSPASRPARRGPRSSTTGSS